MPNVSLRQLARQNDWNPGYAHKLKAAGRLVVVVEDGKELIDDVASLARIAQSKDLAKGHMADVNAQQRAMHRGTVAPPATGMGMGAMGGGGSTNSTYHQAKTAKEVFDAKNAQLDFEERSGRLVDAGQVRAKFEAKVAALRESLRQLPARLAPLLAAETDQVKCQALIKEDIDRILLEQAARV